MLCDPFSSLIRRDRELRTCLRILDRMASRWPTAQRCSQTLSALVRELATTASSSSQYARAQNNISLSTRSDGSQNQPNVKRVRLDRQGRPSGDSTPRAVSVVELPITPRKPKSREPLIVADTITLNSGSSFRLHLITTTDSPLPANKLSEASRRKKQGSPLHHVLTLTFQRLTSSHSLSKDPFHNTSSLDTDRVHDRDDVFPQFWETAELPLNDVFGAISWESLFEQ